MNLSKQNYCILKHPEGRALLEPEIDPELSQIALKLTRIGVWTINENGLIHFSQHFSQPFKEIWGLEENTFELAEWLKVVHEADIDFVRSDFESLIAGTSKKLKTEFRIKIQNGEYKWVQAKGQVINTQHTKKIIGILTDRTEIKDLEQTVKNEADLRVKALLNEKFRIETMLEAIPDPIVVLSTNGQLSFANNSFFKLYRKLYAKNLNPSFNIYDLTEIQLIQELIRLITSKSPSSKTILSVNGLYLQPQIVHIFLPDSHYPLGTMIQIRDITKFQELENIRKRFVSTVSHELRTPITSIYLSINNLIKYKQRMDKETFDETLLMIKDSAEILNQQIEDLLFISRIESGRIQLKRINFDLIEVINKVLKQLEPNRKNKDIRININTSVEKIMIKGDKDRVGQIHRILLDNAIKYSPKKTTITISLDENYKDENNEEMRTGVKIEMQDQGIGIKNNELPFLFDRFFRSSNVENIQGTGLGLSIAKDLIDLHKGWITVESEIKKGTKFTMFFPY